MYLLLSCSLAAGSSFLRLCAVFLILWINPGILQPEGALHLSRHCLGLMLIARYQALGGFRDGRGYGLLNASSCENCCSRSGCARAIEGREGL